jgi:CBS-domain-containing membrane protein
MNRLKKSFRRLKVRDLMDEILVTIPQQMTLRDAACLLNRARVSSAPVTDSDGHCVGILPASAFVPLVADGQHSETSADAFRDCAWSDWQILGEDGNRKDEVYRHMRATGQLVTPETSLQEVLRRMAEAGTHRILVVDAECRPLGIVSAADVLAVLVHESEGQERGPIARRPAELSA